MDNPLSSAMLPQHIIGCGSTYRESDILVFGAPFDGTVSGRPGTRFAPRRIRTESWDIETYSPLMAADLQDRSICDAGDLDLPFGNVEEVLHIVRETVVRISADGKKPLMIGGEHLVTLPAVEALLDVPEYRDLCVIQMDAHMDLREDYLGQVLSHATVMRRIWERCGDGRIWQTGIRSGTREEYDWAASGHTRLIQQGSESVNWQEAASGLREEIGRRPVYLTVDLDVLDPSEMPGTGTPEAGGLTFREWCGLLCGLRGLNLVGADLVELCPPADPSGISVMAACKALREMLLLFPAPGQREDRTGGRLTNPAKT